MRTFYFITSILFLIIGTVQLALEGNPLQYISPYALSIIFLINGLFEKKPTIEKHVD